MAPKKRLVKNLFRLVLPIFILLLLAAAAASIWLIHTSANPPKAAYLVTPEKYGMLSPRGAQVTDETWANRDNTQARGWLLRGSENAPAVILLHRYGADRSWMLDLGVKINEATNFTILMPDERAHGENPPVKKSSFGGCETNDVAAAIEFLRGLKTADNNSLVGKNVGIYGVEMGAFAGLQAASKDENIKAMVLDSVPLSSNDVLASAIEKRFPVAGAVTSKIAGGGTYLYYAGGCYNHESSCDAAKNTANRKVLLLAGSDAPNFQDSTRSLQNCFPNAETVETKVDLPISGYGLKNASLGQSEPYERQVIEFFRANLSN